MVPLSRKKQTSPACPTTPAPLPAVDRDLLLDYSKMLKALAHPVRLEMLQLMGRREICVCEFEKHFSIKQPTISHHLKLLKEAGVLYSRQRGYWVYYGVNPDVESVWDELPLKLGWSRRGRGTEERQRGEPGREEEDSDEEVARTDTDPRRERHGKTDHKASISVALF